MASCLITSHCESLTGINMSYVNRTKKNTFLILSLSRKVILKMFAACVLLGFLEISALGVAANEGDVNKTRSRQPRHWRNLYKMAGAATGRSPGDFLNYGHYCGHGNEGDGTLPGVDELDECCRVHDACYDVAVRVPCKDNVMEKDTPYLLNYRWNFDVNAMTVDCEDYGEHCKTTICECDSTLVQCLRTNLDSYNVDNWRKPTSKEVMKLLELHAKDRQG